MSKVIVQVSGGLVQAIFSTDPEVSVVVLDFDSEGADADEIMPLEELEGFMDGEKATPIDYKSGVFEEDFHSVLNLE